MVFRHIVFLHILLATLVVAEPLTPETATRLALEQNPELAAARELIVEAEASASGLGRLPNPELETELALGRQGRGRIEVGLSQTFPRASRLRLERRAAAESLLLARREVALAELALVARTRLAVIDLAAAQAERELVEKQAALAREFAVAQATQVRAGQLSALDSAQADLMAREAELAVAFPRAAQAAASMQLASVLGRDADASLTVAVDLALPPDEAAVPPPGLCADVSLAEAQLSAADAEIALARSQGREDFKLGVFVEGEQDRSELGGREQEAMLGVRFSMPLPVRSVAVPLVAEKQAARRRVALEREARVREAVNEVAASAAEVRARHVAARAIATELLPAARAHLAAAEAAYARGEIDLVPVFRARERLAEIERSDLAARLAYHRAAVRRLSAACCIPL
jgi:cobalt-zinc-cadmium efflux system outer membrane protein